MVIELRSEQAAYCEGLGCRRLGISQQGKAICTPAADLEAIFDQLDGGPTSRIPNMILQRVQLSVSRQRARELALAPHKRAIPPNCPQGFGKN